MSCPNSFPTQVVEMHKENPWISYEEMGLQVKHDKHKVIWKNGTDKNHAWTGLMLLEPGQVWPIHSHTTPEIYWILQGNPIVSLNHINNRTSKWQCITIPSGCPHGVINDTNEDVVINYTYVSLTDKATPDNNYNWNFIEDPFAE